MTVAPELQVEDGEPSPAAPIAAVGWRDPVRWVLGAMVVGWSILFIVLGVIRHERYATFSFDLGIYDQAVWLLSRFHDPFVTVRGMEYFGHHVNLVTILFVPFYWLGAGPTFLTVSMVVMLSFGAVGVFRAARFHLTNEWHALILALAFLVNYAGQWMLHETFHPEVMAVTPLFFASSSESAKGTTSSARLCRITVPGFTVSAVSVWDRLASARKATDSFVPVIATGVCQNEVT